MLSAWRKFTRKQDDKPVFPAGVIPVDQTMQKKFAKGVQYNLKIIIKGDRNTGKSTLLRRLSGSSFKEEYIPTHEIQVANINWNYRGACDIVKVEVWDIVDKSRKKRTPSGSLKITNTEEMKPEENEEGLALDAESINVYQGTHGVILTMDITKAWTWQYTQRELDKIPNHIPVLVLYTQRELDKIPNHIPVLVLANFRDMGDRRVVQSDEIEAYLKHYERPTGSAELYFSEASMKDGFGLSFIYKFLNMPFLILQRETLLKQLEANALEIEDMRETLSIDFSSEEQNYDLFHEMRLKGVEPNLSPSAAVDAREKQVRNHQESEEESCPPIETSEPQNTEKTGKQLPVATVPPTIVDRKTIENSREERQTETTQEKPKLSRFQEYKAKLFGAEKVATSEPERPEVLEDQEDVVPIDDFHPGSLDDNFLNSNTAKAQHSSSSKAIDSDSDDDGNPMVADYEDLESEDDDDSGGVFQQQLSNDAEFDDLSEDEKPRLEESAMSIIDQIKKRKKKHEDLEPNHDVATSDYHVLSDSADVNESYGDLDTDLNNELGRYEKRRTHSTAAELNNHELQTNKQITKKTEIPHNKESKKIDSKFQVDHGGTPSDSLVHKESDSEQEQDNKEYVIAGDVDVNDDWIKDSGDDGTKSNVDASQSDIKVADGVEPEGTEDRKDLLLLNLISRYMTSTNIYAYVKETEKIEGIGYAEVELVYKFTVNRKDTAISFDLDDLEMFMNSQMEKVESSKESEKPGEQKKKKKKKKVHDVETGEEEKHMKKKKSKKVSKTNTESDLNREVKKNKKPKTKTPNSVPEKREKKKKSKSDLDAFLDGF